MFDDNDNAVRLLLVRRELSFVKRIIVVLLTIILFTACTTPQKRLNSWQEKNDPDYNVSKYGQSVIDAFISKDSESLKSLLNKELHSMSDIDEIIQQAFDFIDGDIENYGDFVRTGVSSGGTDYTRVTMYIADVKVRSRSDTYSISMRIYINNANEDLIGIDHLTVHKESDDGKSDLDSYEIGINNR